MAKSLSWKKVKYFNLTGQRQRLTLLIATWPLKVLCLGGFLFYIKAAESQSVIKINSQMCVTDDDVIASQDKTKLIISRFSDQTCVLCCSVVKNSRRNPANK